MDSSSPSAVSHGTLVNVDGAGVLITGRPGIGKSECALELVSAGHRLVADDVVEIEPCGATHVGRAPDRFAGLLEVRGLGILDVRQLFGECAFQDAHQIELCIEFCCSDEIEPTRCIASDAAAFELLGLKVPKFILPMDGRRNMRLLVETAVKLFRVDINTAGADLISAHDELVSRSASTRLR